MRFADNSISVTIILMAISANLHLGMFPSQGTIALQWRLSKVDMKGAILYTENVSCKVKVWSGWLPEMGI